MKIRKMKVFIFKSVLFIQFLFLFSCIENIDRRGLSEDEIVQILIEIHKAEAKVDDLHLKNVDSSIVLFKEFERDIYQNHGVDSADFRKIYDNYVRYPNEFNRLYTKVNDQLKDVKLNFKLKKLE